jgi:hypothetical protein
MDNTRRVREPRHAAGNAVKPACRNSISEPCLKRVLSMHAVMDDMRTILWPDRCDQQSLETDFVSEDRARK